MRSRSAITGCGSRRLTGCGWHGSGSCQHPWTARSRPTPYARSRRKDGRRPHNDPWKPAEGPTRCKRAVALSRCRGRPASTPRLAIMPATREVAMKRVGILVGLSVGLIAGSGVASAQKTDGPFILGNIDSSCVTSGAGVGDWTITCGDIAPGSGTTLIAPSAVDSVLAPVDVIPAPAPDSGPAAEPAAVDDPATAVPADAVAETPVTDTDTDGDGISDDYEINVYATDPGLWDTDGDGLSDGEELLTAGTDPFVWDTDGDGAADGDEGGAGTDPLTADEVVPEATLVDSDNDRLADADEAAVGTDPTTPDADGDGYYDGDEVNLGSDPLDPASFPMEEQTASSE